MSGAELPEDPDKIYRIGDMEAVVDKGVAWLPDKSIFAGSVVSMHKMFKILVKEWSINIQDAVKMSLLENHAALEQGKITDLLLMDKAFNIKKVIKSGVELSIASLIQISTSHF